MGERQGEALALLPLWHFKSLWFLVHLIAKFWPIIEGVLIRKVGGRHTGGHYTVVITPYGDSVR